jgi:hypothetical protein
MRITATLTLALIVFGAGPALHAQSLADAARKEVERRKTTKDGGKVYTNADLKPVVPPPPSATDAAPSTPAPATEPAAASTDASKAPPAKPDDKEKSEKFWSGRMQTAREQLEHDRVLVEALQSRVNGLTTEFVNRDDPAQRAKIGADRQRALAELDRLNKAVEADAKAVTALEEEARHKGIPPGWIR